MRILFFGLLLAFAVPAQAQRVAMVVVQPSPPSDRTYSDVPSAPDVEDLSSDLAAGFQELQRGGTPEAWIPPAGTILVPAWLRGAEPPYLSQNVFVPGCGDATYRIRSGLGALAQTRRARFFYLMAQAACEAGVPIGLFDALIVQESRYDPTALSPKGAFGLAQLMPGTARSLQVNSFSPIDNLRGGARYLRQQLDEFGRVDLALAAYNAGPGRVRARWAVPPFRETIEYVAKVSSGWGSATYPVAFIGRQRAVTPIRRSPGIRRVALLRWE